MLVIVKGRPIEIDWYIFKGANKQAEDFSQLDAGSIKVFLVGPSNKGDDQISRFNRFTYEVNVATDDNNKQYLKIDIDDTASALLDTGIYDIKVVWVKNSELHLGIREGNQHLSESRLSGIFAITADSSEDNTRLDSGVTAKKILRSFVEPTGYDGLSAYEIAVMHGYTEDEQTWSEEYTQAEDRTDYEMDETKAGDGSTTRDDEKHVPVEEWVHESWAHKVEVTWQNNETTRQSQESTRQSNETTRKNNEGIGATDAECAAGSRRKNESIRVSNESTRQSQEGTRQDNETTRGQKETARQKAEGQLGTTDPDYATSRVKKELDRQSAESTRISNEEGRVAAEGSVEGQTGRAYAESVRVSNESTRQSNEGSRGSAETARQKAEGQLGNTDPDYATSRIKQELDRQSAEAARELAETARENAKISSTTIEYAVGDSGTTPPSSGWQSSIPSYTTGDFLWGRTTMTFGDGTSKVLYAIGSVPDVAVSQNASTGKTTITVGSDSYDVATEPVSVSQNTETGTDGNGTITIGGADKGKFAGADKLIHLVAIDSTYGDHLQNVGDTMYLTGGKVLKRLVAVGSIQTVPYYSGAIYEYQNNLYIWNGTDLVLVNNTELIPILKNKLIKLVGMGTASGGDSGVTAVGDVFYNTSTKKILLVTKYTSSKSFQSVEIPYYDGAIYTYNNELYIWNGTDLVLSNLDNTTKKLKETQTVYDTLKIELGSLNNSGAESNLTNRARTVYLKAPFEIQLSPNREFATAIRYVVQSNGELVYDSADSSISGESVCIKSEGIWRLVMKKHDNTDITSSELLGMVSSYQGVLDWMLEDLHDISTHNLNDVSLWELGYYNGSGVKTASDQRVRIKDKIDSYVNYIKVATSVQYYLIAWDSGGTFKKFWDGGKFQDTATLLDGDIDLNTIRLQNQGYTFAIFGVADNVADYASNFMFLNEIYKINVNIDEIKVDEYNKESLWVRAYVNSSGVFVSSTNRIATKNFIDESIDIAYLTHVYPYYPIAFVVAYKEDGSYAGMVQSDDLSIESSGSNFEMEIPIRTIRQKYPTYHFRIVLRESTNKDITTEYYSQCQFKNLLQARMDRIEYNKPIVTFIDDDGSSEQYDNWKLIYDACGICCSFAVVTVGITSADEEKIKQYGNLGFEFVSHSHGHSDLTTRTEKQLIADFRATTAALRNLGIKAANPEILVYPYNYVNDLVVSVAQDYFKCGIEGGEHRVNGKPLDRFHIRRESMLSSTRTKEVEIGGETVNVAIPKNLEEWKPFIDDLVAKNGWLVIMSHFRNSYERDHYYFDESYIPPVVALAKYALSRGCEILTAGAAYEKFKNRLEIGKVTDEHHYIVDCNGKVYDTMELL